MKKETIKYMPHTYEKVLQRPEQSCKKPKLNKCTNHTSTSCREITLRHRRIALIG